MDFGYTFHPVGQGCFFTSRFRRNDYSYVNVVYDCGSISARDFLIKAIDSYKSKIQQLDMLVISHFDEDHVNGVKHLLSNLKCKILVIPFVTIIERLAIFASGKAKAKWHIELLRDPLSFFTSYNKFQIERIIIVGGNDENNSNERNISNNLNGGEEEIIFSHSPESNVENLINHFRLLSNVSENLRNKVEFYKLPLSAKLLIKWDLKFYNQFNKPNEFDEFRKEIETEFQEKTIEQLFNKDTRNRVKNIYKKHLGNLNFSSLSFCCTINSKFYFISEYTTKHCYCKKIIKYRKESGILLTGDSDLKDSDKLNSFTTYFNSELTNILIFQIPHHGSNCNSRLELKNPLMNFPLFVINHGNGRKKHPSNSLRNFIKCNKLSVCYNNEYQQFCISFYFLA